jgi:hypothetical protein
MDASAGFSHLRILFSFRFFFHRKATSNIKYITCSKEIVVSSANIKRGWEGGERKKE